MEKVSAEKLAEEFKTGMTIKGLAIKYCLCETTVRYKLRSLGLKTSNRATDEEIKERDRKVMELIRAGKTYRETAEIVGININNISQCLYRYKREHTEEEVAKKTRMVYDIKSGMEFEMEIEVATSESLGAQSCKKEKVLCKAIKQYPFVLEYERYDKHGNRRVETVDLCMLKRKGFKPIEKNAVYTKVALLRNVCV